MKYKGYQRTKSLDFSRYEFDKFGYVKPPIPSFNANLYTGAAFNPDSTYQNYPVYPDANYFIHKNLLTANPPPNATLQYIDNIRPGNNHPLVHKNIQMCTKHTPSIHEPSPVCTSFRSDDKIFFEYKVPSK